MTKTVPLQSFSSRRGRAAARALVLAAILLYGPRTATADTLLEGDIRALAISGDRVAALRGGEVILLSTAGRLLGTLARERARTPLPAATKRRRPSADEVLDFAGITDDDLESDAAEQALDDEEAGPGRGRRRDRAAGRDDGAGGDSDGERQAGGDRSRGARLLAASDHRIWIGGGEGLSRLATDLDAPGMSFKAVAVGPRRLAPSAIAAAPAGDNLAALAGDHLLRSSDGGGSWSLLAVLTARPRAIEISADGRSVYLLDDDGVAVVAHRERKPILDGRAYHLVRCGEDLLILGQDGVYAWREDRGVERRSARIPARRLVCSPSAPGVVQALGQQVLTSLDGGRTWTARDDLPALDVQSLALGADRLWIGTANGLIVAPISAPIAAPIAAPIGTPIAAPPAARAAPVETTAGGSPRLAAGDLEVAVATPVPSSRFVPWLGLFPRVSLIAAVVSTRPGADRSELWLLVSFPLGRARARGSEAARPAADRLRRRAAAAVELVRRARVAADDDESAALLRLAREEQLSW